MAFSDAGRIGFVIKGNYDATATYEFLDVVYSNNATYIARKVTTGDPVTDTTAWFCALNADLNGMVHSATINPSASAPFAVDWLMENGAVITPQSNDLYRVLVEGKERLYFWNGTSYEILSGGGHTIEKVNPTSGAITPMDQQDNLLFTGVNVTNDNVNKRTTIHGQLKVCATKAEWDALSQAERDDPNTYWVRPWADTVAFATDKTPVGAVLSVATAKDGEVTDPVIHTPSGTFPTDDYLVCNGQSVPQNKYPALAKYFEDNFGSVYYFTNPPYVAGYFSLPNWSSDFPSNGVLVMKARESSNAITFAEIDDTSVSEDKIWSSQKVNSENTALKAMVTDDYVFSPTKAYAAGDWLIHNNILYEVLVACTGVTPPNATYYEVKTLHDLQSEINDLSKTITGSFTFQDNGVVAYKAIGKIVLVSIVKNGIPTAAEIGTLPSALAPDTVLRFPNYRPNGYAQISPSGKILLDLYEVWCNTTCVYIAK